MPARKNSAALVFVRDEPDLIKISESDETATVIGIPGLPEEK